MMEKHPVENGPLRMPKTSLRLATHPRCKYEAEYEDHGLDSGQWLRDVRPGPRALPGYEPHDRQAGGPAHRDLGPLQKEIAASPTPPSGGLHGGG